MRGCIVIIVCISSSLNNLLLIRVKVKTLILKKTIYVIYVLRLCSAHRNMHVCYQDESSGRKFIKPLIFY